MIEISVTNNASFMVTEQSEIELPK